MLNFSSTDEAKLRWRCRRGMRELDALLLVFLEKSYGLLSLKEKQLFADLLELPDPDLHAYLVGKGAPIDPDLEKLLKLMRAYKSD